MRRLLRTIRFDASDDHVFPQAAGPDEWAVSGGFAFSGAPSGALTGKTRQAFANGFLSIQTLGRATFVTVVEVDADALDAMRSDFADLLLNRMNAPSLEDARKVADSELDYALELAGDLPVNTLLALRRHFDDGEIREEFRIINPPGEKPHAKVWEITDDE